LNDNMGIYVANQVIKLMIKKGYAVDKANVLILGITFKENCPDIRNSRVIDVIEELQEFGCNINIYDPWANKEEVKHEYNLELQEKVDTSKYEAIVLAVAHKEFKTLDLSNLDDKVVFDIKSILDNADGRL
ncbi:Vi polysaccharide biosynthesis UDP-N-acetylglucosamine C-6 dehydrogenase TviB, partial [Sulfurimonas sp.]|nr:Vi polysaccharide biosynthesis UDP-N-acetylglucosamine C-6 dehydrogenase TviB [Sulfurimonas sp.]